MQKYLNEITLRVKNESIVSLHQKELRNHKNQLNLPAGRQVKLIIVLHGQSFYRPNSIVCSGFQIPSYPLQKIFDQLTPSDRAGLH